MPTSAELERFAFHEAGHVVATLVLQNTPGPVVVRCVTSPAGVDEIGGSFQVPVQIQLVPGAGPPNCADDEIRLAAGRIAEEIRFGNYGNGVNGDMSKINVMINFLHHSPAERNNGFPATRNLLQQHWAEVERIATICHRKALRMNLPNGPFQNTQVLSVAAVSRIVSNHMLAQAEHAQASVIAYYRSLSRGNGNLPPLSADAVDDFQIAAGDLLSEL